MKLLIWKVSPTSVISFDPNILPRKGLKREPQIAQHTSS
jgi:hypothetical protein